jgi:hypothetical protein
VPVRGEKSGTVEAEARGDFNFQGRATRGAQRTAQKWEQLRTGPVERRRTGTSASNQS